MKTQLIGEMQTCELCEKDFDLALMNTTDEFWFCNQCGIEHQTKYKIHFQDNGQDFLEWHINENGTVINAEPFQSEIWTGSFVLPKNIENLKEGATLIFTNKYGVESSMKHKISKIEIQ